MVCTPPRRTTHSFHRLLVSLLIIRLTKVFKQSGNLLPQSPSTLFPLFSFCIPIIPNHSFLLATIILIGSTSPFSLFFSTRVAFDVPNSHRVFFGSGSSPGILHFAHLSFLIARCCDMLLQSAVSDGFNSVDSGSQPKSVLAQGSSWILRLSMWPHCSWRRRAWRQVKREAPSVDVVLGFMLDFVFERLC